MFYIFWYLNYTREDRKIRKYVWVVNMTRRLTHIDCFAGPGGICTGFHAAGFETLLAIELVESCVETYSANHRDVPVINRDIREVTNEEVRAIIGDRQVDVLTSGMPCETFSTAGSTSRSFYDHRQFLYREAIRIADAVNAKMILFENVPGIQTKKVEKDSDRLIIEEIYDDLARFGYVYHVQTQLNAEDFGVPQSRERFFILASREELPLRVPVANHSKIVTVEEAFIDLPEQPKETINSVKKKLEKGQEIELDQYKTVDSDYTKLMKDKDFWKLGEDDATLTYHFAPEHRAGTLKRLEMIDPGEGLKDLFDKILTEHGPEEIERLQKEKILPNKWYIQRNRRLFADKTSVTVTSHCLSELVHPFEHRALTVREVARLQSFPDFYDFKGGKFVAPHKDPQQDKYEQIGDAVPPLLAYHWGLVIKEILEGVLEASR
jgi:DNA (cytosine-5)-methyltransferase 1